MPKSVDKKKYLDNYNGNNIYKMVVSFNPQNGNIIISLNDELIFPTIGSVLKKNRLGLISDEKNTVFEQILSEKL